MGSSELDLAIGGGAQNATLSVVWVNGPSDRSYLIDAVWFDESGKRCESTGFRVVPRFDHVQEVVSWTPGSHQVHIVLRCQEPMLPHGWRSAMAATSCNVSSIEQVSGSVFQQEVRFRDADHGTNILVRLKWSTASSVDD